MENQEVFDMVDRLKGMLSVVADTFVNASNLAQKVNELETKVNEMSQAVEHYTNQIRTLDEALTQARSERDEAQTELSSFRVAHLALQQNHDDLTWRYEQTTQSLEQRDQQVQSLSFQLDQSNGEVRALQEQVTNLLRKQEEYKAHLEQLWKSVNPQPRDESSGQFQPWPQAQVG
jgi:chromosome segregation ATPase